MKQQSNVTIAESLCAEKENKMYEYWKSWFLYISIRMFCVITNLCANIVKTLVWSEGDDSKIAKIFTLIAFV